MNLHHLKINNRSLLIAIIIFCLIIGFSSIPVSINRNFEHAFTDLKFTLRGKRPFPDYFMFIHINAEDIQAIGSWPLTRDYYGYVIHILHTLGAKVIGFDLLFDTADLRYPENDESFGSFMETSKKVCLPMVFSKIEFDSFHVSIPKGVNTVYPIHPFKKHAAAIGFSNLGYETIIRNVPIAAFSEGRRIMSFGYELARLFVDGVDTTLRMTSRGFEFLDTNGHHYCLPVDREGRLRLNHFGDISQVQSMGFLDLLQTYQTNPDSINLKGKLVLIAVTSPGLAPITRTPMSAALPASLIHATVAENLIQQNSIRILPFTIQCVVIAMIFLSILLIDRLQRERFVLGFILVLVFYWIASLTVFVFGHVILPLFYPSLSGLLLGLSIHWVHQKRAIKEIHLQSELLRSEIEVKQSQLEEREMELSLLIQKHDLERIQAEKSKIRELEKQIRDLQTSLKTDKIPKHHLFPEVICSKKSKMNHVLDLIAKIQSDDISVLISGETGTGKELIARAIHQSGHRAHAPFIAVNCGALPETLLESELFGHEKGSFSGALAQRRGRFELANGGTLFLDEITETTLHFQSKLLRVLQEGTYERVGGEKTLHADVRIIAATGKNIEDRIQKGLFREDLFYRLNGFPVKLPSLRDRIEDIPLLVNHFLKKYGYQTNLSFSDRVLDLLKRYLWPGNVRELENVIRRAAILARSESRDLIQMKDIPLELTEFDSEKEGMLRYQGLDEQILEMLRALQFSHSAIGQTAKGLGNRDRGTVTEYFRGLCFQYLTQNGYDLNETAKAIAGTQDNAIVERIKRKIEGYLGNLKDIKSSSKGLPQKYHEYLEQIFQYGVLKIINLNLGRK